MNSGPPHGLEARSFLCPDVFRREVDGLFTTSWLQVGRSESIAEPGQYFTVSAGRSQLVVTRDSVGQIHCFHNVCRHRAAAVCASPAGKADQFVCPYHGWTYRCDGSLAAAPGMPPASFDPKLHSLKPVDVVQWEGFIFVRTAGPRDQAVASRDNAADNNNSNAQENAAREFAETFADVTRRLRPWKMAQLLVAWQTTYEINANWKLLFQNFSECYHCSRVHPQLQRLSDARSADNDLLTGPVVGGPMQLNPGIDSLTTDGRLCGPLLDPSSAERRRQVYFYTWFPNLFLSPHPDYVLVHQIRPRTASTTSVLCQLLVDADAIGRADFDPSPAAEFWDQTNRQDWAMCESSHRGIDSAGYQPGPYTPRETMVAAFDRYYLSVL